MMVDLVVVVDPVRVAEVEDLAAGGEEGGVVGGVVHLTSITTSLEVAMLRSLPPKKLEPRDATPTCPLKILCHVL
jgi:hypothetical protein